MEKSKNLLDYTKIDALDYAEQIELLEEKLGGREVCLCGETFTVYEDKEVYYIDIPGLGIGAYDKSDSLDNVLITIMTGGQEQSINFDDYQSLDDIYNSSFDEYGAEEFIEFVKEVSERNHLYFDIHREDDGRGGEYYIISDGERELKVDGCSVEFVEDDEEDEDDDDM